MSEFASAQDHRADGTGVLISGGTSGLGLATGLRFARAGTSRIVLVGRDQERGANAVEMVSAAGAKVHFIAGDAGHAEDSTRIVAEAADFLGGRIDALVSAVAPRGHAGPLDRQDPEDLERILHGLVLPVMQMNRAALGYMKEFGGTIVNVASDAAKVPTPGESVVGGAMAAIAMFSRTLAVEAKRYKVRVHTVTPSLIAGTPTAERLIQEEFGARIFEKITAKADLGLPDADEVATIVLWLTSDAAAKVTGQVISVNGGISAG